MKDTTTRSGMLWEVERILTECYESGSMPQLLLMENVPQVHSEDNLQDFNKWKDRLEQLGYKNYFQDLIATDYGIPQTRNRCFMVSILGEYNYTFPKPIPLKLKLKDLLEENVPEKYYLTDRMINCFMAETQMGNITRKDRFMANLNRENPDIANSITTLNGSRVTDTFIFNRHIKETLEENQEKIKDGCYIDAYNRKIRDDDLSSVISTRVSASNDSFVVVNDKSLYTDVEKQLFTDDGNIRRYIDSDIIDKFEEGQMATTTFPNGYGHGPRTHDESISLNTIDRPSVKHNLRIRKLTPRECFRLMGVKDEDYDRCAKNQSDASLFHLAGDSIVVNVLMAIFKEMIGSDKE